MPRWPIACEVKHALNISVLFILRAGAPRQRLSLKGVRRSWVGTITRSRRHSVLSYPEGGKGPPASGRPGSFAASLFLSEAPPSIH